MPKTDLTVTPLENVTHDILIALSEKYGEFLFNHYLFYLFQNKAQTLISFQRVPIYRKQKGEI